jgi:hypothetical protein
MTHAHIVGIAASIDPTDIGTENTSTARVDVMKEMMFHRVSKCLTPRSGSLRDFRKGITGRRVIGFVRALVVRATLLSLSLGTAFTVLVRSLTLSRSWPWLATSGTGPVCVRYHPVPSVHVRTRMQWLSFVTTHSLVSTENHQTS